MIGIVAIIAGHVWTQVRVEDLVFAWHVPVFFFLTGWLWNDKRTIRAEISSRSRSLLVPYVSWLVLIGIVAIARVVHNHGPVLGLMKHMVEGGRYLGRPFSAFWFVTALFALCILRRLLGRFSLVVVSGIAVVLLAASYPVSHQLARTPEEIGLAVPTLLILVAGEWARKLRPMIPVPLLIGPILVIGPLLLIGFDVVRPPDLKGGDLGTPGAAYAVALAICLGLVLTALEAERFVPRTVRNAFITLASVGLAVILSHAAVLWVLGTPATGNWTGFVAALVIPWVVGLLIVRTPAARLLIAWPARSAIRTDRGLEPAKT